MAESSSRPLAVITAASSGIGFELAKQFAANDFDLLIAAEDGGIDARDREGPDAPQAGRAGLGR